VYAKAPSRESSSDGSGKEAAAAAQDTARKREERRRKKEAAEAAAAAASPQKQATMADSNEEYAYNNEPSPMKTPGNWNPCAAGRSSSGTTAAAAARRTGGSSGLPPCFPQHSMSSSQLQQQHIRKQQPRSSSSTPRRHLSSLAYSNCSAHRSVHRPSPASSIHSSARSTESFHSFAAGIAERGHCTTAAVALGIERINSAPEQAIGGLLQLQEDDHANEAAIHSKVL